MTQTDLSIGQALPSRDKKGAVLTFWPRQSTNTLEDVAQMMHLEEGKPLPVPDPEATSSDADLVELVPPSVEVGAPRP